MNEPDLRKEAHQIVDSLPEGFTWEDLMERIFVRQAVQEGLCDAEAGRTLSVEEVRARYGLEP